MIQVKDLTFAYEGNEEKNVIENMSFDIKEGTLTAIVGMSGCGKSTLCQILCGMIPNIIGGKLSGQVYIDGSDIKGIPVSRLAKTVGFVMQDPDKQLVTTTVEDEIAFGPENLAIDPEKIREIVTDTLRLLQIEHLALENPMNLSGGQKQIVAIGSILAVDPKIIILDEPMSHIDEAGRKNLTEILKKLRERGKTLIVVEHDYKSMNFADNFIVMEKGGIKMQGSLEEVRL